jgi:hypothetical protein
MEERTRRECCACGVHTTGYVCGNCGCTELVLVQESRAGKDTWRTGSRKLHLVRDPRPDRRRPAV